MGKKKFNCPNCGAPITSDKCPYCGTVFYDFCSIDTDSPSYIKIKYNNAIFLLKVKTTSVTMENKVESIDAYGGVYKEKVFSWSVRPSLKVDISFDCLPFNGDHLCEIWPLKQENKKGE